jgi:hypothetical protein
MIVISFALDTLNDSTRLGSKGFSDASFRFLLQSFSRLIVMLLLLMLSPSFVVHRVLLFRSILMAIIAPPSCGG